VISKRHLSLTYRFARTKLFHSLRIFVTLALLFSSLPPQSLAQVGTLTGGSTLNLPVPGTMVKPSAGFVPPMLRGLKVHLDNPFRFDFVVDMGDSKIKGKELKEESERLIKYFLASLTVPEEEIWVNLSPYEQDRIIPEKFGVTVMGRDLLAQDYILKQLTVSLIYPETDLGKAFWDKVYQKAYELYGTTNIPINTFNKVWIVPGGALVYETANTAFISESHLKVMLEEDYLALNSNLNDKEIGTDKLPETDIKQLNNVSSKIVKEVILPAIEKEVNEGKNFAMLRQIYHSLILAAWYKKQLMDSFLGEIYVDKNRVAGVDVDDKTVKGKIYDHYLEAFQKRVYDYIKEDYDQNMKRVFKRQYTSGGFAATGEGVVPTRYQPSPSAEVLAQGINEGSAYVVSGFTVAEYVEGNRTEIDLGNVEQSSPDQLWEAWKRIRKEKSLADAAEYFWREVWPLRQKFDLTKLEGELFALWADVKRVLVKPDAIKFFEKMWFWKDELSEDGQKQLEGELFELWKDVKRVQIITSQIEFFDEIWSWRNGLSPESRQKMEDSLIQFWKQIKDNMTEQNAEQYFTKRWSWRDELSEVEKIKLTEIFQGTDYKTEPQTEDFSGEFGETTEEERDANEGINPSNWRQRVLDALNKEGLEGFKSALEVVKGFLDQLTSWDRLYYYELWKIYYEHVRKDSRSRGYQRYQEAYEQTYGKRLRDLYDILGVLHWATEDEIKKAYRKLAMQYHPDRNPGDHVAEERFKELFDAYEILRDRDKRAKYDEHLANAGMLKRKPKGKPAQRTDDKSGSTTTLKREVLALPSPADKESNRRIRQVMTRLAKIPGAKPISKFSKDDPHENFILGYIEGLRTANGMGVNALKSYLEFLGLKSDTKLKQLADKVLTYLCAHGWELPTEIIQEYKKYCTIVSNKQWHDMLDVQLDSDPRSIPELARQIIKEHFNTTNNSFYIRGIKLAVIDTTSPLSSQKGHIGSEMQHYLWDQILGGITRGLDVEESFDSVMDYMLGLEEADGHQQTATRKLYSLIKKSNHDDLKKMAVEWLNAFSADVKKRMGANNEQDTFLRGLSNGGLTVKAGESKMEYIQRNSLIAISLLAAINVQDPIKTVLESPHIIPRLIASVMTRQFVQRAKQVSVTETAPILVFKAMARAVKEALAKKDYTMIRDFESFEPKVNQYLISGQDSFPSFEDVFSNGSGTATDGLEKNTLLLEENPGGIDFGLNKVKLERRRGIGSGNFTPVITPTVILNQSRNLNDYQEDTFGGFGVKILRIAPVLPINLPAILGILKEEEAKEQNKPEVSSPKSPATKESEYALNTRP